MTLIDRSARLCLAVSLTSLLLSNAPVFAADSADGTKDEHGEVFLRVSGLFREIEADIAGSRIRLRHELLLTSERGGRLSTPLPRDTQPWPGRMVAAGQRGNARTLCALSGDCGFERWTSACAE